MAASVGSSNYLYPMAMPPGAGAPVPSGPGNAAAAASTSLPEDTRRQDGFDRPARPPLKSDAAARHEPVPQRPIHAVEEQEPSKPVEYAHEYLLHGYEGTHRAAQLKEITRNFKGLDKNTPSFPSAANLADHFSKMGALAKGFTGAASVAGLVVGADALRRKDWAEAGDGFAHGVEGGLVLGGGALAKRQAARTGVTASLLKWAGRAVPVVNIAGGVAHFFHNKEHAQESGDKLMWAATAADAVTVAAGIAALLPTPLAPAALAVSSGAMVADIGSVFLNGLLHPKKKPDHPDGAATDKAPPGAKAHE